MIYEYALAGLARPGFQFDGAQVRHVLCADDIEALAANEAQIRGFLLAREVVR